MHKYALVAAIAIAVFASLVSEASAKLIKATVSGPVSASDITSGACPDAVDANGTDTYDSMCPTGEDCKCLTASSLVVSGGFGKGTAVLTATESDNPTVVTGSSASACSPAFAVLTLSIKAKGKVPASTQTLNALGAICGSAGATTVNVLGGFTINASNSSPPASGSGIFNGTVSTSGQVSILITGLITNP